MLNSMGRDTGFIGVILSGKNQMLNKIQNNRQVAWMI
jgi:hypothetical protein